MAFNTELAVTNKAGTRLDVSIDTVVVEDTSRFYDDNISLASEQSIEGNLDIGTVVEILSINIACTDTNLLRIVISNNLGGSDSHFVGVFYTTGILTTIPNIRYTVAGSSNNDLTVTVSRLSGSGSVDIGFSMVYRLTAP